MNMQTYVSPSVASRFTNGALKLETADTKLLKDQDLERPKFAASRLVIARPFSPKKRGLGTRLGYIVERKSWVFTFVRIPVMLSGAFVCEM